MNLFLMRKPDDGAKKNGLTWYKDEGSLLHLRDTG